MKKTFIIKLGFFILIGIIPFGNIPSSAQVLQSRNDIIKERGSNYKTGVTDDGIKYIYYDKEVETERSGKYIQRKAIYFFKSSDGTEICTHWKIIEPKTETNNNVMLFRNKLVEIDYMKWKDYSTNLISEISVEGSVCVITAWYDLDKE